MLMQVWWVCSVTIVRSIPERFRGELLTMGHYTTSFSLFTGRTELILSTSLSAVYLMASNSLGQNVPSVTKCDREVIRQQLQQLTRLWWVCWSLRVGRTRDTSTSASSRSSSSMSQHRSTGGDYTLKLYTAPSSASYPTAHTFTNTHSHRHTQTDSSSSSSCVCNYVELRV